MLRCCRDACLQVSGSSHTHRHSESDHLSWTDVNSAVNNDLNRFIACAQTSGAVSRKEILNARYYANTPLWHTVWSNNRSRCRTTTQLTILVSKTDQGCGWPFCLSMVKADPAVQTHSKKRSGQTEPLETHQSIAIHARLRPLVCHRAPERPALAPASLHLLISRQFPSAPMAPKRPDSTLDVRKKCGTASQERRWTLSSRAGHNYAKLL